MLSPCADCPFRTDVKFFLGEGRREEIANSLLHDKLFGCHKTTAFDDDGNYTWTEKERPCAGASFFIKSVTGSYYSNLMFRLSAKVLKIDIAVDPQFHQILCSTLEEFLSLDLEEIHQ